MSKLNWIKCSERLPELNKDIFLYTPSSDLKIEIGKLIFHYDKYDITETELWFETWIDDYHVDDKYITHWAEIDWPQEEGEIFNKGLIMKTFRIIISYNVLNKKTTEFEISRESLNDARIFAYEEIKKLENQSEVTLEIEELEEEE